MAALSSCDLLTSGDDTFLARIGTADLFSNRTNGDADASGDAVEGGKPARFNLSKISTQIE
jgi:hypothetical protein